MVQKVEDYKWSSYCAHIGLVNWPKWLHFTYILSQFSQGNFCRQFRDFTNEGNLKYIADYFVSGKNSPIIGTEDFIKRIKSELLYKNLSDEIAERKILRPSLNQILLQVSQVFEIDQYEVRRSVRGITNNPRRMMMLISSKYFGYTLSEISSYLEISRYHVVSKSSIAIGKIINNDSKLKSLLNKILEYLQKNN